MDGQGGGIGATLIKYLKAAYGESVVLIALGTNAIATSRMLKAGANKGASGENAICRTVAEADCIVGPIAITWANSMLTQERVQIVGVVKEPLPHLVQAAVEKNIKEVLKDV